MSIVGTRPPLISETNLYEPRHKARLAIKPGITGMKKLTESGQLKRFDTGIYYIPKKSMFRSGSTLSVDEVIRRKYLADGGNCCGSRRAKD